ncbi:GNAT family N-acetyltransferase [Polymorphospora rubra]|uniref:GNAT family N-acetyltransferase n=1 Tax=Polymorphospora rubra TaxID=338584 RepID=UPI0033C8DB61
MHVHVGQPGDAELAQVAGHVGVAARTGCRRHGGPLPPARPAAGHPSTLEQGPAPGSGAPGRSAHRRRVVGSARYPLAVPEVSLRPATGADIPDLLAFWQAAAEDAHRPADTARAVEALVARDPEALILAVDGGSLVGSVIAGWDGWRCHLYRLAVAPTHRGRGIGRLLIAAAEERFRRLGGTRADAMVLVDNEPAHRAWRAAGYTPQAEWARWVKPLRSE